MANLLRFLGGAALLAVASLSILPAPNHVLWLASVAATEYGHWLAIAALLPLIPTRVSNRVGRMGGLLSLAAIPLLLLPAYRARELGADLRQNLEARFGTERRARAHASPDPRAEPFVLQELVRPIDVPAIRLEERTFNTFDGRKLTLGVYRPGYVHDTVPAVIVVDGEYRDRGDESEFPPLNAYLASRDYVVAAMSHRIDPRRSFPASRDDVMAAIAYLKTHAAEFGVDPDRLALLGRAEAGELALLGAYTASEPAIRGVVSIYAPTDLRFEYDHPSPPSLRDTRRLLEAYVGGSPSRAEEGYFAASPINFVTAASPPTLLIHGLRDQMVPAEQSARLDGRLEQAGVKHAFVRLPWATHGCDKTLSGPCGQIVLYAVERFLDAVTIARPAPQRPPHGQRAQLSKRQPSVDR